MLYNSDPSGPYLMIPTGTPQIINGMAADQAPLARFQAVQGVGGLVEFDASGSISPVGTIVSYAWNFGDGSAPSLTDSPTISHVYSTAGSYTVTLTVTNSAGTSTTQIYNTASYWNGYVIFNPGILLNGGSTAQLEQAVIVSPPIVTSVSPKKGSCQSDEEVKIEGTGFLGAIAVFFGDERATNFTIVSDTLIKAEVPKGCGKVAVTVQSLVGTSPGTVFYKYIPKEPRDANGFQDFNILKQQFDNVIVWEAPYKPHSNGKKKCCKITSYLIYSDPKLNDLIGEVSSKSCKNDCVAYEYVDKNVKEGKTYTYYIVSVDSSGHKSDPAVVKVKPIKVGLPCDRFLPGKKPFIR